MNLVALADPLVLVTTLFLAVVFPAVGLWDWKRLLRWNEAGDRDARIRYYRGIHVWEWGTVAVLLSWWFLSGRDATSLGLAFAPSGWQWGALAAGLVLAGMLILQMTKALGNAEELDKMRSQLGGLEEMVPRNSREARSFEQLSLTAGVCEEVVYRGVLLAVLIPAIGIWPAAIASSVIFGMVHLYQGGAGFLRTSVVGLVFAALTIFSGSLYIAMIVHAVMDVTSGRIMRAALAAPPAPTERTETGSGNRCEVSLEGTP